MQDEKPRVIQRVVRESRRVTYRVYFGKTSDPTSIQDVSPRLQAFGCLIEWYSPDYLALDVPLNAAHPVVVYLVDQERRGRLIWEDGTRRGVPGGKT
jgi:hypothetical protein